MSDMTYLVQIEIEDWPFEVDLVEEQIYNKARDICPDLIPVARYIEFGQAFGVDASFIMPEREAKAFAADVTTNWGLPVKLQKRRRPRQP